MCDSIALRGGHLDHRRGIIVVGSSSSDHDVVAACCHQFCCCSLASAADRSTAVIADIAVVAVVADAERSMSSVDAVGRCCRSSMPSV